MGQRELNIINEARITLNDTAKHRWTDERLMKLLCNGQQEFCREVPIIVHKIDLMTGSGQEEYSLPDEAIKVLSARASGRALDLVSFEEMDYFNPEWEDAVSGTYTHLVVNNLSQHVIRPYPKLAEGSSPDNAKITIRYSAKPALLGWDEEKKDSKNSLEIADMWDYALQQYVISKAFIDYGDESSLSRSQVAQNGFYAILADAKRKSKKGFSKRVVTTGYQARTAISKSSSKGYLNECRPR